MQIAPGAIALLDELRDSRSIPSSHGLRIARTTADNGDSAVHLGFTAEPARGDSVEECEGIRLFVASDVVDSVADATLDVKASTSSGVRLVLRRAQTD